MSQFWLESLKIDDFEILHSKVIKLTHLELENTTLYHGGGRVRQDYDPSGQGN